MTDPDSTIWSPGSVIAGRYRVERELGRGGWGVVLAVVDEGGRPLALKILLQEANEVALRRFEREAAVISALHSAHVCRIHETRRLEDGSPFIAMERLEGSDLDELLRRQGPLPVMRAVDLIIEGCDAIAEAHLNGVVHRDIKPSNLFLAWSAEGRAIVKVLDFGIAKARRTDLKSLTGVGAALGTPYYMPPEQLVSSRDVDARADIWALGVTLFELLTGTPCFRGDTVAELFSAVLRDEPIPLEELRPDAPAALGAIIRRCLDKDAELRFRNVAELVEALAPYASDHGRTIAQRIVALTDRRGAGATQVHQAYTPPGSDRATTLDAGALAQAPTLADAAPTYPGQAQRGVSSGGSWTPAPGSWSGASWPGADAPPAAASHPSAGTTLASANDGATGRRSRAPWLIAGGVMGLIVVGLAIALGLRASQRDGATTGRRGDGRGGEADPSGPCHYASCELRMRDGRPLDAFDVLEPARTLGLAKIPEATLRSVSSTLQFDQGAISGALTHSFVFGNGRQFVQVSVTKHGTTATLANSPLEGMGTVSMPRCDAKAAWEALPLQGFEAIQASATYRELPMFGVAWTIVAQGRSEKGLTATVDGDCQVLHVDINQAE